MVAGGKVNPPGPLLSKRVLETDVSVQILKEFFSRI